MELLNLQSAVGSICFEQIDSFGAIESTKKGNMEPEISGELVFLHYAYFCIEIKMRRGFIGSFEAAELTRLVECMGIPTHRLLWRCFPSAVEKYVDSIGVDPFDLRPWTAESVRAFWRNHKGRVRECDTIRGIVDSVNEISAMIVVGDKRVRVFNKHKFSISPGDTAFCHLFGIAEVSKKASG